MWIKETIIIAIIIMIITIIIIIIIITIIITIAVIIIVIIIINNSYNSCMTIKKLLLHWEVWFPTSIRDNIFDVGSVASSNSIFVMNNISLGFI